MLKEYKKYAIIINVSNKSYKTAFKKFKYIITNPPILRNTIFTKRLKLITAARNFVFVTIGAILTKDGHPISYASRSSNTYGKTTQLSQKRY